MVRIVQHETISSATKSAPIVPHRAYPAVIFCLEGVGTDGSAEDCPMADKCFRCINRWNILYRIGFAVVEIFKQNERGR